MKMNRNEAQAHCILSWSLLSRATVNVGLRELPRHPRKDLVALLVHYKRLTPSQADLVKRAVDRAIKNNHLILSDSQNLSAAKARTRDLNRSETLEAIEKTDDLIKTFRMVNPSTILPQAVLPDKHQPEDIAAREGFQDNLRTMRVDPRSQGSEQSPHSNTLESSRQYLGMHFTNFKILGEIASGANGVIFRAWHIPSRRVVALKVLFDNETDSTVFARFRREAKVLKQLSHPNIVSIIDHGYENNDPYLAMEYILGDNVNDIVEAKINKGQLPDLDWIIATILPIAKALDYCHKNGAIHRDIKPTNIVVENSSRRPVLVDFGLVKRDASILTTSVHASLSHKGEIVGTPAFMSPEQLDARGSHGEILDRTDVWGLGATTFFCVTGETPYKADSAMSTYLALLTREPRRPKHVNQNIPDWLDQLLGDCLQRRIDQRPSMNEFIKRLEQQEKS